MIFEKAIHKFSSNPKQLFLVDGFGALLSIFLLGFVLVKLEPIFGIPKNTLYFLAFLPCLFTIYDFYCYTKLKNKRSIYLKGIAYANLIYCILSIALALFHFDKITYLGWGYIAIEILILIYLATLEIKTAHKIVPDS